MCYLSYLDHSHDNPVQFVLVGRVVRHRPAREPREDVLSADVELGAAIYARELIADFVCQISPGCHERLTVRGKGNN